MRIGIIRAGEGVIIGQLLVSIVGFGALFELYASNFLMAQFWAVLIVLFGLAFTISEFWPILSARCPITRHRARVHTTITTTDRN